VKKHRYKIEFIRGRAIGQQKRRTNFGSNAEINYQTSPLRAPGIVILHLVELMRPFDGRCVTELHILILRGEFQQFLTHRSALGLA